MQAAELGDTLRADFARRKCCPNDDGGLKGVAIIIDFEGLFARSPNPYVVLDPDFVLAWMNDSYLKVTMRERGDLLGRTMFEAFPSDPNSESHRLLKGSLDRVLATGETDELALIRYDIVHPDGSMSEHYWSATHTPLLDKHGHVAFILQHTVDVTELHNLRRLRDEMGVVQRAHAVQTRNLDLSEQSSRLRSMFEQAPGFMAVLSGPDHRFELANESYRELVAKRDLVGKSVSEALPEVIEQGFVALLDTTYASGRAYVGRREKVSLQSSDKESLETRYLDFVYQPLLDEDGEVTGVFVQGHDVTDAVEASEAQELLINELNHRVKNTLAIVQSLAAQSFRGTDDPQTARRAFDARLAALSAAHGLLTDASWDSARIGEIVDKTLGATAGAQIDRFDISGPDAVLPPQPALALAMTLHELATNAIKYGALSNDTGRISLTWSAELDDGHCLVSLEWRESGGPPVEPPKRRGFGTRLIERGLGGGTGNPVQIEFAREGIRCTIRSRHRGIAA